MSTRRPALATCLQHLPRLPSLVPLLVLPSLLLPSLLLPSAALADGPGQYSASGEAVIGTLLLEPDQPFPTSRVDVRERPARDAASIHSGPGATISTADDGSLEIEEHVRLLRIGAEEWQIAVYGRKGDWVRVLLTEPTREGWIRLTAPARFISLEEHFRGRTGYFVRGTPRLVTEPGADTEAKPPTHSLSFVGLVRAPPMPARIPRDAALPYPGLVRVFANKNDMDEPLHHFARSNTESWIASFQDGEHLFDRAIPILREEGGWLQAAIPHEDAMSFPLRREKYRTVEIDPDGIRRVWLLANEVSPLEPITSDEVLRKAREAVLDRYMRKVMPELHLGEIRETEGRMWIHVKTFGTPPQGDPSRVQIPLGEGWLPLLDDEGKFNVWFFVSAC